MNYAEVEFIEMKPNVFIVFKTARDHLMNLLAKNCVDDVSVVCLSKLPKINSFNRIRALSFEHDVVVGNRTHTLLKTL